MNRVKRAMLGCGLGLVLLTQLAATNAPAPAAGAAPGTNFIDPALLADNPQLKQLEAALHSEGGHPLGLLDTKFLFASVFWGAVGGGYLLYARRQREIPPFVGGVAMLAASYLVNSWVLMSLLCVAAMVGVWQWMKQE